MSKEVYYFSHDYNPTNDPKIICLIGNYGGLGYGIYWRIIEMLHQEDNYKLPLKLYIYESVAKQMLTTAEQVELIIKDCVDKYELFQSNDGLFWSNRVVKNIETMEDKRQQKSVAGKIGMNNRWHKKDNNVITENNKDIVNITNEIKLNEIDINNNSEPSSPKKKIPLEELPKQPTDLQGLYKKMGLPPQKKRTVNLWQDEASSAIKFFTDGNEKISSIFKCFRDNNQLAKFALSDCKELSKNSSMYFFKVYNELLKKGKNKI
jgi:hypothetical protein